MAEAEAAAAAAAHVLVFPFPLQGHINCMFPFATALVDAGVRVTFLHTDHNLRRLGLRRASATGGPRSRSLRFLSIPDGLPDDDPRSGGLGALLALVESLQVMAALAYRDLLASLLTSTASPTRGDRHDDIAFAFPPVTCVVADAYLPWVIDISDELGVPVLAFRTSSAGSALAFLSVPRLLELGELPFPEDGDLNQPVRGVPGMEGFLRRRDLPSSFRLVGEHGVNPRLRVLVKDTFNIGKAARALVVNTAASLERSALAHVAPHMRDVFAIGPLHAMFPAAPPSAATSLWREDDGCVAWLDAQADRSVVYASLGSIAVITREQFTELLSGLVATGYPFLWVLRPDMVGASQDAVSEEVAMATGGDGGQQARVVAWAPQREVLRHRAVGCFLTHAGWNSTVEGVVQGVPMVCWPFFADQQINSRFVGAVWRNGLDMKDVCDRAVVEKTVREAMESAEIRRSAEALARQVKRDVAAGGSSATEFQRLIGFIRELSKSDAASAASGLSQ